ncbi:MAG: hypothetical protein ACIAXF_12345 [Phycisphaerales bacterium JB063]
MQSNPRRLSAALLLALAPLACVGCSTYRETTASVDEVSRLAALDYPADVPYGPDLDILLVRSNADIRLVNRTPHNYNGMVLWLNQQYAAQAGSIRIGTDNVRTLTDFINRHREPYPVGTLLNPDQTDPLVLAELYNPALNIKHRLLVRPGNEENILPFETLE